MGELQPLAARCMDGCCAGQTGCVQVQLLLAQHCFAGAACPLLCCSQGRQSGHSTQLYDIKFKLNFRRRVSELTCRGQSYCMHAEQSQLQKAFLSATTLIDMAAYFSEALI